MEDDEEKLLLYEKLERYDSRVTSLEREVMCLAPGVTFGLNI